MNDEPEILAALIVSCDRIMRASLVTFSPALLREVERLHAVIGEQLAQLRG